MLEAECSSNHICTIKRNKQKKLCHYNPKHIFDKCQTFLQRLPNWTWCWQVLPCGQWKKLRTLNPLNKCRLESWNWFKNVLRGGRVCVLLGNSRVLLQMLRMWLLRCPVSLWAAGFPCPGPWSSGPAPLRTHRAICLSAHVTSTTHTSVCENAQSD